MSCLVYIISWSKSFLNWQHDARKSNHIPTEIAVLKREREREKETKSRSENMGRCTQGEKKKRRTSAKRDSRGGRGNEIVPAA